MKKSPLAIAIAELSVAALARGIAFATTGGSASTPLAGAVAPRGSSPVVAPADSTIAASRPESDTTVRTAMARVEGTVEVILVTSRGLPLYVYEPDTATTSMVAGELAALWPPLVNGAPTGSGTSGVLAVVRTVNGPQVTYNGHFLYTFAEDSPGHVTRQGGETFSVATPGLAPNHAVAASGGSGTIPAGSGPSYS